ncbi:MAG: UbiA family prenyltransferase [Gemmatimonadaceae bacterium]
MEHAAQWRSHGAARRAGYALLPGEGFSYLLHLRPREWPIMAAHTLLGLLLAVGLNVVTLSFYWRTALVALAIWVICLNGGTLALNSAYDMDVGDIGYLDAPPPPPRHLAAFGFALMLGGQLWTLAYPVPLVLAYAACFIMSLVYSAPPIRLKSVPGADWLINVVGFGALTPFAGWVITGRPLTTEAIVVFVAFAALFGALYPLTQLYQLDEDAARGDRTMAVLLGARGSLAVSLACALAAFAMFAWIAHRTAAGTGASIALLVSAACWLLLLARWLIRAPELGASDHKRGMYVALSAWALTDVAVLALFA